MCHSVTYNHFGTAYDWRVSVERSIGKGKREIRDEELIRCECCVDDVCFVLFIMACNIFNNMLNECKKTI